MRMRLVGIAAAIVGVAACSATKGTEPIVKNRALDPYVSILVIDSLDTTQAPGRANWRVGLRIVDTVHGSGMNRVGSISLPDMRRFGRYAACGFAGADSVGARFVDVVAIADTTTEQLGVDTTAQRMFTAWGKGDTTLDAHWMAIHTGLINPWDSQQFKAGHGLVPEDPIRWYVVWKGRGTVTLTERQPGDTTHWTCF